MSGLSLTRVFSFPWISFGLFCLTYGVFGWLVGATIPEWQAWILGHHAWFPWTVNEAIALVMSWGFGGGLVLLLMVVVTAPMRVIHLLFGSWLQSDIKALLSVLAWAFAAVLIICWLEQFVRCLILVSAGMLCNLDLQLKGYTKWQVLVILTSVGCLSFALGGYLFTQLQIEISHLPKPLNVIG